MDLLDCLVVHLCRLNMRGDGVGQKAKLADVRRHANINTFTMIVHGRIGGGKRRWETTIKCRTDEFTGLSEKKSTDMVKCKAGLLHRIGDCHGLEVAPVVDVACHWVDERVIRGWKYE
jgi:hypothetical protein